MSIWKTLRDFGLNSSDLSSMIKNVALLMRLICINIDKKSKPIPFIFYTTTAIASACYFYVYVFSLFWMIFFYYGKAGDWIAVAVVLGLGSCTYPCVTKFVFMKLYAKDIMNTVEEFLKCDSRVIQDTKFASNLKKYLRIVKRRATTIWGGLVGICTVFLSVPILRPGRHFTLDYYVLYGLVPMFESPNYEIAMSINTIGTGLCVYIMVCTSIYVIVTVGYVEAQLRALSEELDDLWYDSQDFYEQIKNKLRSDRSLSDIKEKISNKFIAIRLRDVVKFHVANISLLQKLDQDIRPTLALECGIIGCSIIAELLGGLERTYLQIPYSMIQVVMDCLAGQRLIDACNIFEFAIYSCKWENFNVDNQKTILLLLAMSQKTLVLTAGGLVYLNFSCMMSMLKSTYSIYTTLNSMIE